MSSLGSADPPVICTDCCLPVPRSLADTFTMPLASMSKVTSTCGTPRGAGAIPASSNMPSFLLYAAISRSPWKTWICTDGWLSSAVVKICERLVETLQTNPTFRTVSVRYINKIEINTTEFSLESYFNYMSTAEALPPSFDGTITGFFYRTGAKHNSSPLDLALNFASLAAPKDTAAFLLDIDLTYNFEEPVGANDVIAKTVEIKATENSIFESLITDATRELFK